MIKYWGLVRPWGAEAGYLSAGLGAGLGGAWLLGGARAPLGGALLLAGLGLGLWPLWRRLAAWMGRRRSLRVSYPPGAVGRPAAEALSLGLDALAGTSRRGVSLVWRREAGAWTLYVSYAPGVEAVVRRVLGAALPGVGLLPATLPDLPAGGGFYRWAGTTAALEQALEVCLRQGGLEGEAEVRLHWAGGGGAAVLYGTPGPDAAAAGLKGLGPGWNKRGPAGPVRAWLFRHYPCLRAWPEGAPPLLRLPASLDAAGGGTDTPAATALAPCPGPDAEAGSYPPPPESSRPVCLGVTAPGGVPVRRAVWAGAGAHPDWGGAWAVLGGEASYRGQVVSGLLRQAAARECGLVYLAAPGAGEVTRWNGAGPGWRVLDLDTPAGARLGSLLAVPPRPTGRPEEAEAAALGWALEVRLPLLGAYLESLDISPWLPGTGARWLLHWARLGLLVHHRLRLIHQPAGAAPDLAGLLRRLSDPERLGAEVGRESRAWHEEDAGLTAALNAADVVGKQTRRLVQLTLRAVFDDLAATNPRQRWVESERLRLRLARLWEHPLLGAPGGQPGPAPETVFAGQPAPRLAVQLAVDGPAVRVAEPVLRYLLLGVVAAAKAGRRTAGGGPPLPLLMVVEEPWSQAAWALLRPYHAELGAAGVTVLYSSARTDGGGELRAGAGVWWLYGSGAEAPAPGLGEALRAAGVPPGSAPPPGTALLGLAGRSPLYRLVRAPSGTESTGPAGGVAAPAGAAA